jgi:hypothetical protein
MNPLPAPRACAAGAGPSQRKHHIDTPIEIGKYLVSPLTKRLPDSRYAASVSIRSGRGTGTHDRVLRLAPLFHCRDAASRYALDEGMAWLNEQRLPKTSPEMAWPRKN